MNTYSLNFNLGHAGFDVNFFNQLDIYISYRLLGAVVLVATLLRMRKVYRDNKRGKRA